MLINCSNGKKKNNFNLFSEVKKVEINFIWLFLTIINRMGFRKCISLVFSSLRCFFFIYDMTFRFLRNIFMFFHRVKKNYNYNTILKVLSIHFEHFDYLTNFKLNKKCLNLPYFRKFNLNKTCWSIAQMSFKKRKKKAIFFQKWKKLK